jgi:hypothetical protein
MIKETGKDYIYIAIILIFASLSSIMIWKTSEQIVYNTISVTNMNLKSSDGIKIFEPKALSQISSPLIIKGSALGTWFFEASFPIQVTDAEGKILGEGHAEATEDWMTEKMVPFVATLEFENKDIKEGYVVFSKDDSSGRGLSKPVKMPVFFTN